MFNIQNKIFDYLRESLYKYPLLKRIASFCYYQGKIKHLIFIFNRLFDMLAVLNADKVRKEILKLTTRQKLFSRSSGPIYIIGLSLTAGGAERQLVNTAGGLRDKGYTQTEIIIGDFYKYEGSDFLRGEVVRRKIPITFMSEAYKKEAYAGLEKKYHKLSPFLSLLPRHLKYQVLLFYDFFKINKPSVVHSWLDGTNVIVGYAALLAGVPRIVLSCRNVNPSHFGFYSPTMKQAYRIFKWFNTVSFINNSIAGADDYCKWLRMEKGSFQLIRNGVNLSKRFRKISDQELKRFKKSIGIPKNAKVVGTVIRFSPEKRPLLWIKSAKMLAKKYPGMHFIMVGWGGMESKIRQTIKRYRLTDRFHLLGRTHDISLVYRALDVLLLTSEFEGTPNVALEAQWSGVPVVLTPGGGAEEAIINGVTGFSVEPSAKEIAGKIEYVLNLKKDAASDWIRISSKIGPEFIECRYGIERMIDETLDIYGFTRSSAKV